MCRTIEGQVHGVLTDYDVSFWKDSLTDHTENSQQLIGTSTYMASELLKGTSTTRLYRHDVESLFYVMLVLCGCYEIIHTRGEEGTEARLQAVMRKGKFAYHSWFEYDGYELGSLKTAFLWDMNRIELTSSFEGFRVWLHGLQGRFSKGFRRKPVAELGEWMKDPVNIEEFAGYGVELEEQWDGDHEGGRVPFDDETLGGCVDYSILIEGSRHMEGELKGLVIRYEPPPCSLRTSTGAVPSA